MRKIFAIVLSAAVIASLVFVGCVEPAALPEEEVTPPEEEEAAPPAAPEAEVIKWRTSQDDPEEYPDSQALKAVCDEVREKTNGNFDITPYFGGVLGDWSAMNEMVIRGDMEMIFDPIDSAFDPRLCISYYFPYLVRNYEEHKTFFKQGGVLFNITNEILEPLGIQTLGAWPRGISGVSLREVPPEPGNPDVQKNMKVRVMPLKQCRLTYERLGYMCTAIPYGEVYSSIQTGIVDGQMGGGYMQATLFKDVQGCYISYNDYVEPLWFTVNNDAYNELPQGYKDILVDACQRQCTTYYDIIKQDDAKFREELEDYGLTVIELTPEELDACATAIRKDVWPELEDMVGRNIIYRLYDELGIAHD